jgi:hypothetical protein
MGRHVDARAAPAARARRVHPEDGERDGKAAAPVDHAREVGIGEVVVAVAVAAIAAVAGQHGGEQCGRRAIALRAHVRGHPVEMVEIGREVQRRATARQAVERGAGERRAGDVDLRAGRRDQVAQERGGIRQRAHAIRMPARGNAADRP